MLRVKLFEIRGKANERERISFRSIPKATRVPRSKTKLTNPRVEVQIKFIIIYTGQA